MFAPWTNAAPLRAVNVSAMTTASQKIGTTAQGLIFHPTLCILNSRAMTGTVVTPATVSIGTNAPNYDNIMAARTVGTTLLGGAGQAYNSPVTGAYGIVGSLVDIYLRVSQAAVGPTAFAIDASVLGFVVDPNA